MLTLALAGLLLWLTVSLVVAGLCNSAARGDAAMTRSRSARPPRFRRLARH